MFSSAKRKKKSTCTIPIGKTATRVLTPGTIADVPDSSSSSLEDSSSGPGTFVDVPDSSHSEDEETSSEPGTSCQELPSRDPVSRRGKKKPDRPKQYMTKHRKLVKKISDKHENNPSTPKLSRTGKLDNSRVCEPVPDITTYLSPLFTGCLTALKTTRGLGEILSASHRRRSRK